MDFITNCLFGGAKKSSPTLSESIVSSSSSTPTHINKNYNLRSNPKQPSDEEILKYENELRQEQAASNPLISTLLPISILLDEFSVVHEDEIKEESGNFTYKIDLLRTQHNFTSVRRCRRDGNCFYRAIAFGLLEHFRNIQEASTTAATTTAAEIIAGTKVKWNETLKAVGFEPIIYEDFADAFWSTLTNISTERSLELDLLWSSDEYTSDMIVMFMRLLTSAQIRANPDEYSAFIELLPREDLIKWCERNVDSVGVDADQVQMIALSRAISLSIVVANLGSAESAHDLQVTEFNSSTTSAAIGVNFIIYLLYRPGHYDLLYK